MHVLIGYGLLSVLTSAAFGAEVDPAEIKAFEDTRNTFRLRSEEFAAEARATVARQEAADRAAVTANYDAIIDDLQTDSSGLRTTAMRRFETFLDRYPDAPHSAHVMFRLAELYFELAEEDYTVRALEHDRVMQSLTAAQLDDAPEQPSKSYARAIALYKKIIERFPNYEYIDGCYYMLGYTIGEPSAVEYDEKVSVDWYNTLITKHPKSPFLAQAHFRVAQYHFDFNELPAALSNYGRAVEIEGPEGALYGPSLYKLAWTNYRLNNYDLALDQLNALLDWSHTIVLPKTGRKADTDPEAIRYTAISLADKADILKQDAITVAQTFYGRVGPRDVEIDVYKQLADVLTQQAKYDEAIALYTHIQSRWPNDKENPTFQYRIAQLYMSKAPPDADAANRAIAVITERYNDRGSWYKANRANPDALKVARDYIEESLVSVANGYYEQATRTQETADYQRAADAFGEYLRKFPFADDYYQAQWAFAQMLAGAGDVAGAQREFQLLFKGGEHHYKEAALRNLVLIEIDALLNAYTRYEEVPSDAVVEKTVERLNGEGPRNVYALGAQHARVIEMVDGLLQSDFKARIAKIEAERASTTDKKRQESLDYDKLVVEDVAKYVEKNAVPLDYNMARILWGHGRFDEARARFNRLMADHPERDEAAYAAKLDVDAYKLEGDLLGLRRAVAEYAGKSYGSGNVKASDFKNELERVDFTIAENLAKDKKHIEAAQAYLAFFDTYPKSPFRTAALSNAANNYERAGNIAESNRLIERFVQDYPEDPASRTYYMRLASNYAQVLELQRAIEYYERLYSQTRGKGIADPNAPDAIFNAGMLRVGLGDSKGAALNYERYAKDNPGQPDAANIYFLAGEQWERVGEQDALRFYRRYINDYPDAVPDLVMESLYKIAVITEKSGRERDADQAWADVAAGYRRLMNTGRLGGNGRKAAAQAAYRNLIRDYTAFTTIKFSGDDVKNAELLKGKFEELKSFEEKATAVAALQDFEYGSGALTLIGKAYISLGDMLYNAPLPKGLTEEEQDFIRQEIDKQRIPIEDKGRARLQTVVQVATDQRQWSRFQDEAQAFLAERFPAEFAPVRSEVRGTGSAADVKVLGPVSLADPKPAPAPAAGGGGQ